jgi:hypothetical protein
MLTDLERNNTDPFRRMIRYRAQERHNGRRNGQVTRRMIESQVVRLFELRRRRRQVMLTANVLERLAVPQLRTHCGRLTVFARCCRCLEEEVEQRCLSTGAVVGEILEGGESRIQEVVFASGDKAIKVV